jgi:GNAT superfamily N-acetyltransferase
MIRKARLGDERGIHEAHMRSIREVCAKDHGEEEIRGWGNRPLGDRWTASIRDRRVWVVEIEKVIQGVAYLRVEPEAAQISALYLAPEALGQGFGERLMQLMLTEARSAGVRLVTLESTLTAHNFYKRFGFEESGPLKWMEIGGSRVRNFPIRLRLDRDSISESR